MTLSRRAFLQAGAAVAASSLMPMPNLASVQAASVTLQPFLQDNPKLHLLNRITWGARPADLARINQIGYESYLDEQLNPESLDDSLADERLRPLTLLNMPLPDILKLPNSGWRSYQALVQGMLLRAAYSERQLLERMVDFWTDHFNVVIDDGAGEMIDYHRTAIRPHALGKFRDMVLASAKHPAMLVYLDNFINYAEHPNENYARELLELHTLGVDGGYTETDVKEVARAFTGWTTHNGTRTGFYFDPTTHDSEEKVILGHTLPAGRGIEDGLHVISILSAHPATARFISRKLCVRFVSDDPPQSLIDSTAQVFMDTDGDIRTVLRHLFTSGEFFESAGQKFRRPLEFFVGMMRATGMQWLAFWSLYETLESLAQMPYGWHPPDGYPDFAAAWMNTGGLLGRWNVALALTHEGYSEIYAEFRADLFARISAENGTPETVGALVDAVAAQVFGVALPAELSAPFIAYAADDLGAETLVTPGLLSQKLAPLFGLMLSSPIYQWR